MNSVIYTPDRLELTPESSYECPMCMDFNIYALFR